MKKSLFIFLHFVCAIVVSSSVNGQYNIDYFGANRLVVNSPSSIQGVKDFTLNFDQGWGAAPGIVINAPVVRTVTDSLACTSNMQTYNSGEWALIYRGDCEFGAKTLNAQQKGAAGVIIVNHTAGAPLVTMGAGAVGVSVTIPALFISKENGDAINNALRNNQPVTISMSPWGFGYANDLTLVPYSQTLLPYGAIPSSQISTSAKAYDLYTGAYVANTGSNTQTNVKLKSVTTFTPTGGSPTVVAKDSVELASFQPADSVFKMFSPTSQSIVTSQLGKFEQSFDVTYNATDSTPDDNKATSTMYVTSKIFSKAKFDNTTNNPVVSGGYRLTSGSPLTWGPLFYTTNGGYKMESVKLAISRVDSNQSFSLVAPTAFVFKWNDGSNGGINDSLIQQSELSLLGIATSTLVDGVDSDRKVVTLPIYGPDGSSASNIFTEDSAVYWIAAQVTSDLFLATDGVSNYLPRTDAAFLASEKSYDFASPLYDNAVYDFVSTSFTSPTDTVDMIPSFITGISAADSRDPSQFFIVGFDEYTPSVALVINQFQTDVKEVATTKSTNFSLYPVPAKGYVTVALPADFGQDTKAISVIDAYGRRVANLTGVFKAGQKYNVDLSHLAAGQYYVTLTMADGSARFQPFTVIN